MDVVTYSDARANLKDVMEGRAPAANAGPVNEASGSVVWVPTVSEQLPLGRTTLAAPPAEVDTAPGPVNNFVVRVIPVDMASPPSSSVADDPHQDEPAVPADTPVGEPS